MKSIRDIIRERVTVLPNHMGLKLSDDTSIEESLQILDWTTILSNDCGFMVGDAVNFGYAKWGEDYEQALYQTGRASDTLRYCASMSALVPQDQRTLTPNENESDDSDDWWKQSRYSRN